MTSLSTFGQPVWGHWASHPQPQQHDMMRNGQDQMYYSSPPESAYVMSGQIMGRQCAMALRYGTGNSTAPSQTHSAPAPQHTDCSSPTSPYGSTNSNAMTSPSISPPPADLKVKKYYCDGPDCNQSFTQKVHLKTHKAAHTGEKPFQCPHCYHSFSQASNLNTHVNNHLGIKNFRCRYAGCYKEFVAKGNCDAHEKNIHNPNPKICRLDQCGKQLSTRGNLKTHINKFHQNTIAELTMRFAQYQAEGHIPEEERSLYEYFREIFKNSNKGVKGRGKGRKVNKINKISSPKKVCKPITAFKSRQQYHRNITGGFLNLTEIARTS